MWYIGKLTEEYRQRMYDLLELYTRSYCEDEPVICVDEKSKQLLEQPRLPIPASPGNPVKEDCEYKRAGTRNIFMAVEPNGGCRQVEVTTRRTKRDFVQFIGHLVKKVYVVFERKPPRAL
ncbi:MAG: transposase [Candidatus Brocadia sp.]|nr:MAG: transposase [Candidatus Brocadia sp.]